MASASLSLAKLCAISNRIQDELSAHTNASDDFVIACTTFTENLSNVDLRNPYFDHIPSSQTSEEVKDVLRTVLCDYVRLDDRKREFRARLRRCEDLKAEWMRALLHAPPICHYPELSLADAVQNSMLLLIVGQLSEVKTLKETYDAYIRGLKEVIRVLQKREKEAQQEPKVELD